MQGLTRLPRADVQAYVTRKFRALGHISAIVLVGLVAACSSDDPVVPETKTIALSLGTSAVTASTTSPANVVVGVVRGGGFTGDVTLTAEGLPAGVTPNFNPTPLSSGVASSVLTLNVGATAVAGNSTVTVRATGAGVTSQTATFTLTISIPSITLTAGSAAASIPQGQTGTVALTLERLSGFAGAVTLAAEGLPANVNATFNPANFGAGVTSSTLTFNVGSAAAIATSTVTIRASGTGVTDKIVTIQLSITSSATPDFTLTATPATLSVAPGAGGQTAINLARTGGFTGDVTFTTSALPTGVAATFTPNPATANTSALAFTTTVATVPGQYTIIVTGSATGQTARTVNVVLTVVAPPGVGGTLAPASATIAAGTSTQTVVTLSRVGGLTGDITMAAENLPAGVTVSFAPTLVTGTSSTATISTTAAVVPGTYPITIRATGPGPVTSTVSFALTVTAAQGFSVAFTSGVVSIAVGGTGALTANITRTGGFAGTVDLAVTGLPAGIAATVNPAAAAGATATVNLTVGAGVAAGTYNGTLNGTATGLTATATPFSVTVTGGGGGGGSIQWAFCDPTRVPLFFAFRSGSTGSWTRVTPSGNAFSFTINDAVGGVSYVQPSSTGFATTVFLQTAAELTVTAASECTSFPAAGGKTVSGSVTGLSFGQSYNVSLGNAFATGGFSTPAFTLNNVANGNLDLVASRFGINTTTIVNEVDKLVIRRGLNQANASVIAPVDFGAAEAFAPATANATISNVGADQLLVQSLFNTSTSSSMSLFTAVTGTGSVRPFFGVPTAKLAAGDLQQIVASAIQAGNSAFRFVASFFRDVTNKAITLGDPLTVPTVTSSNSTVLRPRAQAAFQTDYQTAFGVSFAQNNNRSVTITSSKGYYGAGSAYDLEVPDLAPVSGFNTTWGLAIGTATTYSVNASSLPSSAPVDGTTYRFASRVGNVP